MTPLEIKIFPHSVGRSPFTSETNFDFSSTKLPPFYSVLKYDLPNQIVCISWPITSSILISTSPCAHHSIVQIMYTGYKWNPTFFVNLYDFNSRYTVFQFVSCTSLSRMSETFDRSWWGTSHKRITLPYDRSTTQLWCFSFPVALYQPTLVGTSFRKFSRTKTNWESLLSDDHQLFHPPQCPTPTGWQGSICPRVKNSKETPEVHSEGPLRRLKGSLSFLV